ncbi:hypothetical protein PtA15_10A455 [Puccinia triticina]|uniref:Uncharacterized protein n=1 Tax=Puccinia triticina TaxID=208348 RepID=A0ABY7CX61_9BASI|nr:uncharacterized protein PtA15_10A455 [Puccinia triticina]WAQ89032.1 hypothetical protein PtA15_10A455 [Puccinia triticina]WAR59092.1 hypothetical protein PtB15_10B434 [Puccinia triticina]
MLPSLAPYYLLLQVAFNYRSKVSAHPTPVLLDDTPLSIWDCAHQGLLETPASDVGRLEGLQDGDSRKRPSECVIYPANQVNAFSITSENGPIPSSGKRPRQTAETYADNWTATPLLTNVIKSNLPNKYHEAHPQGTDLVQIILSNSHPDQDLEDGILKQLIQIAWKDYTTNSFFMHKVPNPCWITSQTL